MTVLNYLMGAFIGYLILFGLKDREPPTVIIKFPTDGYEYRTMKMISLIAEDNKGIKSITYFQI